MNNNVTQFAKANGYDNAIYKGRWRGYGVYEPVLDGEGTALVGLPYVILVNGWEMRMCTQDECFKIMHDMNK